MTRISFLIIKKIGHGKYEGKRKLSNSNNLPVRILYFLASHPKKYSFFNSHLALRTSHLKQKPPSFDRDLSLFDNKCVQGFRFT